MVILKHILLLMTFRHPLIRLGNNNIKIVYFIFIFSGLMAFARWQDITALAHLIFLTALFANGATRFSVAYALFSAGIDASAMITSPLIGADRCVVIFGSWEIGGIVYIILRGYFNDKKAANKGG